MNHMRGILIGVVCMLAAVLLGGCGNVATPTIEINPPTTDLETQTPEPVPVPVDSEEADSDQDALYDDQELTETLTDPANADTDGDGLGDGQEVIQYGTSPLLADTDGDGMTDFQEIRNGGTSPLLADMPQLRIELFGNPSIDVNYKIGESTKTETVQFVENKELKENSESVKTNLSIENNIKLHTEAEVGTSQWPPSASAKLTTDSTFSHGYFQNTSSNWEQSALKNIQKKYETLRTANAEYTEGKLSVAIKVTNLSPIGVHLKNLVVNIYQPDQTVIGNIKPNVDTWPEGGGLIKPGGSITLILENEKIPAQKVQAILENPTALIFEVAAYEMFMVDSTSQDTANFDILAQNVIKQTSMISINYGDGTLERYLVATNVVRNSDGSAKGITLAKALSDIIGLEFGTCPQKDASKQPTGVTVLCQLENREQFDDRNDDDNTTNGYGFWTIGGTGPQFGVGRIKNFNEIVLKPKQSVSLVYLRDSDGDRIFDSDEYLLGTNKDQADTDGDGLTDYDESRVGWEVALIDRGKTSYHKTSDPLFANQDGDGWNDKEEYEHKTDPEMADTDGDEIYDEQDDIPLGTCLAVQPSLGLAAWWQPEYDPSNQIYFAKDIGITGDVSQNGMLEGDYDPTKMVFYREGIPYFSMNRGPNTDNQYIRVASNELLKLTGKKDFTFAADIIWDGEVASGQDRATVVSKGSEGPQTPTFALYVTKNGAITFTVYRHVKEKHWDLLGCDSCAADEEHDLNDQLTTESGVISKGQKYHIIATFTDDYMRIYVDGVLKKDFYTPNKHQWRAVMVRDDFMNLITNNDPFVIGNTLTGESSKWPFKGMITNVQFFNVRMIPDNVIKLDKFDLCLPSPQ